jgi:hypothetical protein
MLLGKEHPVTADSLNDLARLYEAQGRQAEAAPLLLRSQEIMRKVNGKTPTGEASSQP